MHLSIFLKDTRDDLVRNKRAILVPMLAIFVTATGIVTESAVKEKRGEEEDIEVASNQVAEAMEPSRVAPKEGAQNLRHVVEMTRNTPPARGQQEGRTLLTFLSGVGSSDVDRVLPPHGALAIGGTENLALTVSPVVDKDTGDPRNKDKDGLQAADILVAVLDQEIGRGSVDGGHPNQAAPADVVARAVVLDVHGAEVAGLPVEELGDVHELQRHRDEHGVGEEAVDLVLRLRVAKDAERPVHHAEAAVGEHLHVEPEHAWVQLRAPVWVGVEGVDWVWIG